jgi:predicted phosphoribosyltransferase
VVILEKPLSFHAVAQVYRHWHDVSDKEVLNLLKNYQITSKGGVS